MKMTKPSLTVDITSPTGQLTPGEPVEEPVVDLLPTPNKAELIENFEAALSQSGRRRGWSVLSCGSKYAWVTIEPSPECKLESCHGCEGGKPSGPNMIKITLKSISCDPVSGRISKIGQCPLLNMRISTLTNPYRWSTVPAI